MTTDNLVAVGLSNSNYWKRNPSEGPFITSGWELPGIPHGPIQILEYNPHGIVIPVSVNPERILQSNLLLQYQNSIGISKNSLCVVQNAPTTPCWGRRKFSHIKEDCSF